MRPDEADIGYERGDMLINVSSGERVTFVQYTGLDPVFVAEGQRTLGGSWRGFKPFELSTFKFENGCDYLRIVRPKRETALLPDVLPANWRWLEPGDFWQAGDRYFDGDKWIIVGAPLPSDTPTWRILQGETFPVVSLEVKTGDMRGLPLGSAERVYGTSAGDDNAMIGTAAGVAVWGQTTRAQLVSLFATPAPKPKAKRKRGRKTQSKMEPVPITTERKLRL